MPNPPVPFPLKVLRGNPGKRPMKPEPQPEQATDVPAPPPFITGYAADEWWRTAPELQRLGLLTVPALAAYCHAFDGGGIAGEDAGERSDHERHDHQDQVWRCGDESAGVYHRKHAGDVIRFASEFGLTSVARTRLALGGFGPSTPLKFDGLLK